MHEAIKAERTKAKEIEMGLTEFKEGQRIDA